MSFCLLFCYINSVVRYQKTHGHTGAGWQSRIYRSWLSMRRRCQNPNDTNYPLYGGRGIYVCARWDKSFSSFAKDMGDMPEGYTLDRINTLGNYEPSNCRWATYKTQNRNQRSNKFTEDTVRIARHLRSRGFTYPQLSKIFRAHQMYLWELCYEKKYWNDV